MKLTPSITFQHLRDAIPLIVLDHGRAGNDFFKCLFDQHPEVLVIPHVGYFPARLTKMFGDRQEVSAEEAFDFLMDRTDFRYVAQDMSDEVAQEYIRLGNDPGFSIDRPLARKVLGELLETGSYFCKADIVAAMHAAYAIATGRDVSRVKYILMNDSPVHYRMHQTLAIEQAYESHRGDFGDFVFIHLVRDPRAVFASLRHQFVKQNNGMYPFALRSLLSAFKSIFFGSGAWCVFLSILEYTTVGSRQLFEWRDRSQTGFYVVRNEDLNLRFIPTMKKLRENIGIEWLEQWSDPSYVPTSGGEVWRGVGAYNNTYQEMTEQKSRKLNLQGDRPETHGYRFNVDRFFQNDPENISSSLSGPNRYVTERWKTRLTHNEIPFLEAVYYEEMVELDYQTMYVQAKGISRLRGLVGCLFPLSGELFSYSWILGQIKSGFRPSARLALELFLLAIYFFCSRLTLLRLYFTGKLNPR